MMHTRFYALLWALPLLLVVSLVSCRRQTDQVPSMLDSSHMQFDTLSVRTQNIDSLLFLLRNAQLASNSQREVQLYAELGHAFLNGSIYDEALKMHQQELALATSLADTLMQACALNDMGNNYHRMGRAYDALMSHLGALEVIGLGDPADLRRLKCKSIAYTGAGNSYLSVEHFKKADDMFRKALRIEKRLRSHLGQAVNYANLGEVYERRHLFDSAHIYYQRALHYSLRCGSHTRQVYVYARMGSLSLQRGENAKAIQLLRKAYNLMDKRNDAWRRLRPTLTLAKAYILSNRPDSAFKYLSLTQTLAAHVGTREFNPEIGKLFAAFYRRQGNATVACEFLERSIQTEDSLLSARNLFEIEKVINSISLRKNHKEMSQNVQQLDNERLKKRAYAIAFVFLLFFTILLCYTMLVRRRSYAEQRRYMQMRENFFTNITHEFRTPLTLIMGISADLARNPSVSPSDLKAKATLIESQGKSLLALINQILDISKIKSAVGAPDWRNGNISLFVEMLLERYAALARSQRVTFNFLAKEDVTMDFIPTFVERIIGNLAANAIKFTPENGRVSILLWREGRHLCINVADTGCGIAPESIPHIFDPFYRAENAVGITGSGVGLPMARQAVEAMGGTITVESQLGQGSVFHICLPINNHVSHALALPEAPQPIPPPATLADEHSSTATYTVLVVEDNSAVASYIGSLLHDKYNVCYADDGQMGLEKARRLQPDLIITDVMMPKMDGYQLCQAIRADGAIAHIPIVIVTARITDADRVMGLDAGADAYLTKPFNSEVLLLRVERLLESRRTLHVVPPAETALQPIDDNHISLDDKQFVARLTDSIHAAIADRQPLDVNYIANQMCMSTSQLYRRTTEASGFTPAAFIQRVKVRKACLLLDAQPLTTLTEVATKCGFNDYSSFVRAFRNVCGITPTQYVRQVK